MTTFIIIYCDQPKRKKVVSVPPLKIFCQNTVRRSLYRFLYFFIVYFYTIKNCKQQSLESLQRVYSKFMPPAMEGLLSVEFEVFGKVQGVFFRKHTVRKATELGLRGWVKNTTAGTVKGKLQGGSRSLSLMKKWLQTTGSPNCRIDKAIFKNQHPILIYSFNSFAIKKH